MSDNQLSSRIRRAIWSVRLAVRRATARWRMEPSFIIIGTQKGGTTSLYNYLIQHPDVVPAVEKEVRFFDYNFLRGIDWYRGHFPLQRFAPHKITGEASPNYLFDPRPPARLASQYPAIKLIVLLRDPVERAYSHYKMSVRTGHETLSFADAISAENSRTANELERSTSDPAFIGMQRHHFAYAERGRYDEQLQRWQSCFDREQLLILDSAAFFAEPRTVYDQVLAFLNLDPWQLPTVAVHNAGSYDDAIDTETEQYLRQHFAPSNHALTDEWQLEFGWLQAEVDV